MNAMYSMPPIPHIGTLSQIDIHCLFPLSQFHTQPIQQYRTITVWQHICEQGWMRPSFFVSQSCEMPRTWSEPSSWLWFACDASPVACTSVCDTTSSSFLSGSGWWPSELLRWTF